MYLNCRALNYCGIFIYCIPLYPSYMVYKLYSINFTWHSRYQYLWWCICLLKKSDHVLYFCIVLGINVLCTVYRWAWIVYRLWIIAGFLKAYWVQNQTIIWLKSCCIMVAHIEEHIVMGRGLIDVFTLMLNSPLYSCIYLLTVPNA